MSCCWEKLEATYLVGDLEGLGESKSGHGRDLGVAGVNGGEDILGGVVDGVESAVKGLDLGVEGDGLVANHVESVKGGGKVASLNGRGGSGSAGEEEGADSGELHGCCWVLAVGWKVGRLNERIEMLAEYRLTTTDKARCYIVLSLTSMCLCLIDIHDVFM